MQVVRLIALVTLAFSSACAAAVGVSGPFRVPADSLAQCQTHCGTMGMSIGAVVVMADNVGCVCEEAPAASADLRASAAVGAMGAMVAEQREQEQRRRQQRQQQQQQSAAAAR